MMQRSVKQKHRRGAFFIALGILLMAVGAWQLLAAPDVLQFILAAPAVTPAQGEAPASYGALTKDVQALQKAMEGIGLESYTVSGEAYQAQLSGDRGGSAQARLVAAGTRYFEVYPAYLIAGRLPAPDELRYGEKAMVLDQDLALKLFGVSEPLGRQVNWGEGKYRVIGIVRHARSVGESELYTAYMPLSQAAKDVQPLDALMASGVPAPRTGAASAFAQAMGDTGLRGDCYEVSKEALRGRMLARLCLVVALAYALVALLKKVLAMGVSRAMEFRVRLRLEYARDMLPWLLGHLLLSLLGGMAVLGAIFLLAQYAVEPVYRFPEWVPPVLVEWEDLRATFWALAGASAKPVRRTSIEMGEVRFWSTILRWGLVSLGLGLCLRNVARPWQMLGKPEA